MAERAGGAGEAPMPWRDFVEVVCSRMQRLGASTADIDAVLEAGLSLRAVAASGEDALEAAIVEMERAIQRHDWSSMGEERAIYLRDARESARAAYRRVAGRAGPPGQT